MGKLIYVLLVGFSALINLLIFVCEYRAGNTHQMVFWGIATILIMLVVYNL